MTDPLSRAKRYKERAAECMRLSGASTDQEIARHYQFVAENYLILAQGELALAAAQEAVRKQSDS
jgi:7-keto-8-aminopelargonate synthetase-like enzyme